MTWTMDSGALENGPIWGSQRGKVHRRKVEVAPVLWFWVEKGNIPAVPLFISEGRDKKHCFPNWGSKPHQGHSQGQRLLYVRNITGTQAPRQRPIQCPDPPRVRVYVGCGTEQPHSVAPLQGSRWLTERAWLVGHSEGQHTQKHLTQYRAILGCDWHVLRTISTLTSERIDLFPSPSYRPVLWKGKEGKKQIRK